MEALLKKLQKEVGITREQAVKALSIIKEQVEKGDPSIDWDLLMRSKYEEYLSKAKETFDEASGEVSKFAENLGDKADHLADNTREKLRDLSQKAADFFDSEKKS